MKKLLLASAVAALSVTAAQAAPTLYGKAFLTIDKHSGDYVKNSASETERTQLNSNASRIGVKGEEALNVANTKLVYQLEYGVDVDAGTATRPVVVRDPAGNPNVVDQQVQTQQFTARDTYLGLSNDELGTIKFGRLTAVDDDVNFANVLAGGVLGGDDVLAGGRGRANNTIAYASPEMNGAQVMAMYVMDENNGTDTLGRDAFGLAGKYEMGPMKVGASYIQAGKNDKVARVSGAYEVPAQMPVTVGALYQWSDNGNTEKQHAVTVSGEFQVSQPITAYAQGDYVKNRSGVKDANRYRVAVGGKYALNGNATGHLYGAYLNDKNGSTSNAGYGIGGGLEYKF